MGHPKIPSQGQRTPPLIPTGTRSAVPLAAWSASREYLVVLDIESNDADMPCRARIPPRIADSDIVVFVTIDSSQPSISVVMIRVIQAIGNRHNISDNG